MSLPMSNRMDSRIGGEKERKPVTHYNRSTQQASHYHVKRHPREIRPFDRRADTKDVTKCNAVLLLPTGQNFKVQNYFRNSIFVGPYDARTRAGTMAFF